MELQTENGKKKAPLSTGLKWLRLVCMAVVAIGNALGYGQSVTTGVVSALNRDLSLTDESGTAITSTGLIQTDAAINPGNSGGALLNMAGELIGINEAKTSSSGSGGSVDNIGFAIPIDKAEDSLKELMNLPTREKVDPSEASYLGIEGETITQDIPQLYGIPTGVGVVAVEQGSPAEKAGIQQGDVITQFDGRAVANQQQLSDTLQYYKAGETVDVTTASTQGRPSPSPWAAPRICPRNREPLPRRRAPIPKHT